MHGGLQRGADEGGQWERGLVWGIIGTVILPSWGRGGVADFSRYFDGDAEVERWLASPEMEEDANVGIFAYPAQSNMNGRRLPMDWSGQLRQANQSARRRVYSLVDAAAFVSTAQLDLSDAENAPDFVSISFYSLWVP